MKSKKYRDIIVRTEVWFVHKSIQRFGLYTKVYHACDAMSMVFIFYVQMGETTEQMTKLEQVTTGPKSWTSRRQHKQLNLSHQPACFKSETGHGWNSSVGRASDQNARCNAGAGLISRDWQVIFPPKSTFSSRLPYCDVQDPLYNCMHQLHCMQV